MFQQVVVKYSHILSGYTALNLTKLDILTGLDELKIGVEYYRKVLSLVLFSNSISLSHSAVPTPSLVN